VLDALPLQPLRFASVDKIDAPGGGGSEVAEEQATQVAASSAKRNE
jgi:hypothetical protein